MLQFLGAGLLALVLMLPGGLQASGQGRIVQQSEQDAPRSWPAWDRFVDNYINEDGRVVEERAMDRTTSEGQAYALFFALVAGDRERFGKILEWTEKHLAEEALDANLPAWEWGRDLSGDMGVLDYNSASDADLWLAYTLLEAARLWDMPLYQRTALAMLRMTKLQTIDELPGFGFVLLPGPKGFKLEKETWRLNPSYVPSFLLARLQAADPEGPWDGVDQTHAHLVKQSNSNGLVPDWLAVSAADGVVEDPESGWIGSYDAVRVYLWTGLWPQGALAPADVDGMQRLLDRGDVLPEKIDVQTGSASGNAPPGFRRALAPYLKQLGSQAFADEEFWHTDPQPNAGEGARDYYDYVLTLFGTGWLAGRFQFDNEGKLQLETRKK